MDIFQALGIAGDLTINGKRDDISNSKKDGKMNVNYSDITSSELLISDNFQILQMILLLLMPIVQD